MISPFLLSFLALSTYQATKLMWCPDKDPVSPTRDLLATTGDYLRIWNITPQGPKLESLLNNVGR